MKEDSTASVEPTPVALHNEQWSELRAQPSTPARNEALAAALEKLAATDPARAMALAQAEGNLLLRDKLIQASLRGWAHLSPTDAAKWALTMPPREGRETAIVSVLTGSVASNPAEAVALGQRLALENPGEAVSYGGHLIDLLCDAGDFQRAVQMAASGTAQQTPFWLGEAYSKWASFQPQQAVQSASTLGDPEMRKVALRGLVSGWAEVDPTAAIQFAVQLPEDSSKNLLVGQTLQRWTKVDPKAASEWINGNEMGGAMDQGVASVATMESLQPDVALSWAESVVDPKLRSETLATVLRNLATSDLAAAKQYFNASKNLLPPDREEMASLIDTLSGR